MTIFFIILGALLFINILLFQFSSGSSSKKEVATKKLDPTLTRNPQLLKV